MLGVLLVLAVGVALWTRRRRRPEPTPVYSLWDKPKRIKVTRLLTRRKWSADDLLRAMASASARAWPEDAKK